MWKLAAVLAAGCVVPPGAPPSGSTGSTGSTGSSVSGTCQVAPLSYVACAESTSAVHQPYYEAADFSGSGAVTDVGGDLGPLVGSAPLDGFDACGPEHGHQVRLVDPDGASWTFGWDVDGGVDDASVPIEVGDAVDFHALFFSDYQDVGAFVLSDATGPLFLLTDQILLTDDERGGVEEDFVRDRKGDVAERCVVDDWEYAEMVFVGDGDRVTLWPGDDADLVAVRPLHVVLGNSDGLVGCVDGCTANWWAAWAE